MEIYDIGNGEYLFKVHQTYYDHYGDKSQPPTEYPAICIYEFERNQTIKLRNSLVVEIIDIYNKGITVRNSLQETFDIKWIDLLACLPDCQKPKKENPMQELKVYRSIGGSYYFELGTSIYNLYGEETFSVKDNKFKPNQVIASLKIGRSIKIGMFLYVITELNVGNFVAYALQKNHTITWETLVKALRNEDLEEDLEDQNTKTEESTQMLENKNTNLNLPAIVGRFPEEFRILLETKKTTLSERTLALNSDLIGNILGGVVTRKEANKDDLVLTIGSVTEPLYATNLCEFIEKTVNEVENLSKLTETHYKYLRLMHELDAVVSIKFITPERKPLLLK